MTEPTPSPASVEPPASDVPRAAFAPDVVPVDDRSAGNPASEKILHAARDVLYPNRYAWFVLLSALDIILTHAILSHFADFGGREVNTIADAVISRFGVWGAVVLKFATVILVVSVCEFVGRRRPRAGQRLSAVVVILACVPVAWALFILARFALAEGPA